jgi:putative NADH-flavin reductase
MSQGHPQQRIVVFGATGATGRHVVRQSLDRGWQVVAAARHPDRIDQRGANLTVVRADALDAASLAGIGDGCDAVISTIGVGTSRQPTTLYSVGTRNIVGAISGSDCRVAVVSAVPAGPWEFSSVVQRRVILPMLQRFFGASYDDMRIMETDLATADIGWTAVRPPRLTNRSARGSYRSSTAGPLRHGGSITRADLATALLDAVTNANQTDGALWVAN